MESIPQRSSKHDEFTNHERLAILEQYDACFEIGEKSALCRRLGLDSSTVRRWARDRRDGLLVASEAKKNGHMMKKREMVDYQRLKRENAALKLKLEQAESAVEVLGKASALLEALAKSAALNQSEEPQPISPTFTRPKPDPPSEPR
jgi:transposase